MSQLKQWQTVVFVAFFCLKWRTVVSLPQMRWDMSSCPEQDTRAEEREVIVVSRSYPTKIGQNWTCIYNFFTPSSGERIMIEFDDFLMVGCDQQNLTITDKDTGRTVGPYCNEVMPPKFISDSSKVVVETHTGDLEHEAESRGYMFRFWRVTEAVALQEKQLATQNEFAQADYMDRMNGFGQGMGPGGLWGMGRGPGMMDNGPLHPGQGGGYPNYPNYGQPAAPYPAGTPLGPPLAPDVLDTMPGGKTNYVQPGYGTQLYPDEEEVEEEEFTWTMPKVLGIVAGGLCVVALIAVAIQHQLRRTELKIAKEIAMAQRGGGGNESDSSTSFTSFDSEAEERERRRVKKQIKREKRQQRSDVNSIISDDDTKRRKRRRRKQQQPREEQAQIRTTKANFTQDDLKNATLELQKQKLQQKLQKYM